MTLTEQKKQALDLYINQSYTQQQVADAVGVCVRTISASVHNLIWRGCFPLVSNYLQVFFTCVKSTSQNVDILITATTHNG
jgi:hypothetical protein